MTPHMTSSSMKKEKIKYSWKSILLFNKKLSKFMQKKIKEKKENHKISETKIKWK